MARKNKRARKIYPVSLYQLQKELDLTTLQRVKVGKFIENIFRKEV
jgi:hypothetical protein